MKYSVGIATYCRNSNYGSLLQAYAIKQVIKQKNLDAVFLVYNNRTYKWYINILRIALFHPIRFFNSYKLNKRIKINYDVESFRNKCNLFIEKEIKPTVKQWDELINFANDRTTCCCICGSDQIWNMFKLDVDPFYFLQFAPEEKRIAYAPSFGEVEVPHFLVKKISSYISSIPKLSVREESGRRIINKIVHFDVPVLLDPTLLLTRDRWNFLSREEDVALYLNSVILYFLDKPSHTAIAAIAKIKQTNNCKIYMIKNNYDELHGIVDEVITVAPLAFVRVLSGASCVLTDSFHGTVFSLVMNTNFYTFERQYKSINVRGVERIITLLSKFNLADRLVNENDCKNDYNKNIDFLQVNELLDKERKISIDYLNQAIDKCNVNIELE